MTTSLEKDWRWWKILCVNCGHERNRHIIYPNRADDCVVEKCACTEWVPAQ